MWIVRICAKPQSSDSPTTAHSDYVRTCDCVCARSEKDPMTNRQCLVYTVARRLQTRYVHMYVQHYMVYDMYSMNTPGTQ